MVKITNLTMKNFLSVGNATQAVKLDISGITLVLGSNTDSNSGPTRNGAGKSAVLQAICYGLYGKPLTRIKLPNLVNNINGKGMLVSIDFEVEGVNYRIERGQKPAVLRFYINGKEQESDPLDASEGENRHTQATIERIIGMSYTMFRHIVALNTFTDPFLKLPVGDQRNVIEELLGVTQISTRADTLKKLITRTKENIRDEETRIKATNEANARIDATIKQTLKQKYQWDVDRDRRVKDLKEEIEAVRNIDYDAQLALFDKLDEYALRERDLKAALEIEQKESSRLLKEAQGLLKEAETFRKEAAAIDPAAQIKRLEGEIVRKEKNILRHEDTISKLRSEYEATQVSLEESDNSICVCCGQALVGTAHLATVRANLSTKLTEIEESITREQQEITDIGKEIAPIRQEIDLVGVSAQAQRDILLAKAVAKDDAAKAIKERQAEHDEKAMDIFSSVSRLGTRPSPLFASRDEVYKFKQAYEILVRDLDNEMASVNPYTDQVERLEKTKQPIDMTLSNDLSDLLKHQEFLLKLLINKDSFIRKKIIDQNLSYLNSRMNHYLDKLGLPHEVKFQSDLSVDITLLGRDFDFEQLSRGEMNRVIMATSWSFRDVWESLNVSLNLLWVDEFLDQGMDAAGAELGLAILKSMARDRKKNVFLISHRDDLVGRIDNTMLVRKRNGFSTFEFDGTID